MVIMNCGLSVFAQPDHDIEENSLGVNAFSYFL